MKRIFAALFAAILSTAAYAQNPGTVTNHAFAIGKGPGVTGYSSLLCASAQLAVGQAAADPICRTVSGDWTISAAGIATLATVNANVGTFGSATNCITTTQDAKGRTTAISAATCTPAIGSISGVGTGFAAAAAVNIGTAGSFVVNGGAGGTPSSLTLTNATGLPRGGLTQGVARSVIGVAGNATANDADIQGITANTYLGVNAAGNGIGFQAVTPVIIGAVATVKAQAFAASGTYTPSTGTLYATLECWGAGGGGGGASNSGATTSFAGGGGGAGSYSRISLSAASIGASLTVTVGAAGTAGASTGAAGGNGGDSCFTTTSCVSGQKVAGKGGTGGGGAVSASNIAGGAGGVAGTGDITGVGAPGGISSGSTNTAAFPSFLGSGGSTSIGGGAPGALISFNQTGPSGTGKGAGGAGAISWAAGGAQTGGAGSIGFCLATDYANQ